MLWIDNEYKHLRKDYHQLYLDEKNAHPNPIIQFEHWINDAIHLKVDEPTAMVLSTSVQNKPSSRIVLLKAFDENGFYFFTNYESEKGNQLKLNSNAALNFFWPIIERQVRIEGVTEIVSTEISDEYFYNRPIESQISAIASKQSSIVNNRSELNNEYMNEFNRYKNSHVISRPNHWGGYCIKPVLIEFWQGRSNRLHDRLVYQLIEKDWKIVRKAP